MIAETIRLDPESAQRALAHTDAEPEEIEEIRTMLLQDFEMGEVYMAMPKNAMLKHFLDGSTNMAWVIFMFDWTVVEVAEGEPEFVIADNPVSLYDPHPVFPGGGVGLLSSPAVEIFLPIGPRRGVLVTPNESVWNWAWAGDGVERLRELSTDTERWDEVQDREGPWAEMTGAEEFVLDMNLRTYSHADRFMFGSQHSLQDLRAARRVHGVRLAEVAPRGGRVHILEADPDPSTGLLQITQTFAPQRRSKQRP
jgi:hypothetical protein